MKNACSIKYPNIWKLAADRNADALELSFIAECNAIYESTADKTWFDCINGINAEIKMDNLLKALRKTFKSAPEFIKRSIINRDLSKKINNGELFNTESLPLNPVFDILEKIRDSYDFTEGFFNAERLSNINYNTEQLQAIKECSNWLSMPSRSDDYYVIEGKAGTGKTTIVQEVLYQYCKQYLKEHGKLPKIACAALSHHAKLVLKSSMGALSMGLGYALSFHSLAKGTGKSISENDASIWQFTDDSGSFAQIAPDVIVIDECSMISQEDIDALTVNGSKIIFLGDSGQARPIKSEGKSPLFTVPTTNKSQLIKRERQQESSGKEQSPILTISDLYWNTSTTPLQTEDKINERGAFLATKVTAETDDEITSRWADIFIEGIKNNELYKVMALAHTNRAVDAFNEEISNVVFEKLCKKYPRIQKSEYTGFFIGEPIMFNENFSTNKGIAICNSELVRVINQPNEEHSGTYLGQSFKYVPIIVQREDGVIFTVHYSKELKSLRDKARNSAKTKEAVAKWKVAEQELQKKQIVSDIKPGFACTVYKSQGTTCETVIVNTDDITAYGGEQVNELLYTAYTRAAKMCISYSATTGNTYKGTDYNKIAENIKGRSNPTFVELLNSYNKDNTKIYDGKITKKYVEAHPEKVFLFGDNVEDMDSDFVPSSRGGQAVIRGAENAIGIPTKKNRGTSNESYWDENSDEDFAYFKYFVDSAIKRAITSGKQIVILNGIGEGRTKLNPEGRFYKYLQESLDKIRNVDTEVIDTLNGEKDSLSGTELDEAKKVFGTATPKIVMASEHTDPVFYVNEIIPVMEEENKKDRKDRKFQMVQFMTKHDGLPLRRFLESAPNISKLVHFSITSLGGTKWEPGAMKSDDLLDRIQDFIKEGLLNPKKVTIRIDPIVPGVTQKEDVKKIIERASSMGIRNFKFSIMDSYGDEKYRDRYVIENMEKLGYNWGDNYDIIKTASGDTVSFNAKQEVFDEWYEFMDNLVEEFNQGKQASEKIGFNTCGEAPMKNNGKSYKNINFGIGCVNVETIQKVLKVKGIQDLKANQRGNCPCYAGKTDILQFGDDCYTVCSYCFAGHNTDEAMKYYKTITDENGKEKVVLKDNKWTKTKDPIINIHFKNNQNAILSNFATRPFSIDLNKSSLPDNVKKLFEVYGNSFESVENAFQAAKLAYINAQSKLDIGKTFKDIINSKADTSKSIGKNIPDLNVQEWDKASKSIMKELMLQSFLQNPVARVRLLRTIHSEITHKDKSGQNMNNDFVENITQIRQQLFEEDKAIKENKLLNNFNMHSGGAVGSDRLWGKVLGEYGIKINHYRFDKVNSIDEVLLPESLKAEAMAKARQASMDLSNKGAEDGAERFDKSSDYVKNLLARDWVQVKNSKRILAISKNGVSTGKVFGGTGYAVQMAIRENLDNNAQKEIFVYDINKDTWFTWKNTKNGPKWESCDCPTLAEDTACIGTRDIDVHFMAKKGKEQSNYAKIKYKQVKNAMRQVAYKTIGEVLDKRDDSSLTPRAMRFEYGKNKNSNINALNTFDAIIEGKRTATTRYSGDGQIEFWKNLKVGDIVRFDNAPANDSNRKFLYVRITAPARKLTQNEDVEKWSEKEGWTPEYYKEKVLNRIINEEAYQIEYEFIGSTETGNLNTITNAFKVNLSNNADLTNLGNKQVVQISNAGYDEFVMSNTDVYSSIKSTSSFNIDNTETEEGFCVLREANKGDVIKIILNNIIVTCKISSKMNDGEKTIIQVEDMNEYPYDRDNLTNYKTMTDFEPQQISNVVASNSAKKELGQKEYTERLTYVQKRIEGAINKLMTNARKDEEGKLTKKVSYMELLTKLYSLDKLKGDFVSILSKEVSKEETEKILRDHQQFSSDEEYAYYAEEYTKNKNLVNRYIKEHIDEFWIDGMSLWAKKHNMSFSLSVDKKLVAKEQAENATNENQSSEDIKMADKEFVYKEHWQVEYKHVLENTTIEFREFLESIPQTDENGRIKLNSFGEPVFLEAVEVFNKLKNILSRNCFTCRDMMEKLAEQAKIDTTLQRLIDKLSNNKKRYQTDMFKLFNVEEINYVNMYTDMDEDANLQVKRGAAVISNNTSAEVNQIINNVNKNTLNTKSVESFSQNDIISLFYLTKDNPNIDKVLEEINNDSYIEDLKKKETPVGSVFNTLYRMIRAIGYDISENDLFRACTSATEDIYPIMTISSIVYNIAYPLWMTKLYNNSVQEYVSDANNSKNLSRLVAAVPKQTSNMYKGTIFALNKQFPRYRKMSNSGLILKHLADNNLERREEYIENEFRQYDWFYTKGNLQEIYKAIISLLTSNVNITQSDRDDLVKVCDLLIQALDGKKVDIAMITMAISNLSMDIKATLSETLGSPTALVAKESKWNNPILGIIFQNPNVSRNMKRERILTYNKKDYFDWTREDFTLLNLSMLLNNDNQQYMKVLMPNYSDAGIAEFITMPRLMSEEDIDSAFFDLFKQELERINLIKERQKWRNAVYSAYNKVQTWINHNKKGKITADSLEEQVCLKDFQTQLESTGKLVNYTDNYYYSYPIQNLENVEEITIAEDGLLEVSTVFEGAGHNFQFLSFIESGLKNHDYPSLWNTNYGDIFNLIQSYDEKHVRNIILRTVKDAAIKEAYELVEVADANNLKTKIEYAEFDEVVGRRPTDEFIHIIKEYMLENAAITQLFAVDLAQYKDAVDFQKRFKQVYAGVERPNTEYDEKTNPYARQEMTTFDINDKIINQSTIIAEQLKMADMSNMSEEQKRKTKEMLIKSYSEINCTDGQSYRSLSSLQSLLCMYNELQSQENAGDGLIIKKILNGKRLTNKEFSRFQENSRKPFVYVFLTIVDKATGKKMKVCYQIKNSEVIMFYVYKQLENGFNSDNSVLFALNKFMEDNGIDTVNYESAIKVGGHGAINIEELTEDLDIKILNKYNFETEENYQLFAKAALQKYSEKTGNKLEIPENLSEVEQLYESVIKRLKQQKSEDLINKLYEITKIEKPTSDVKEDYNAKHERVKKSANPEVIKVFDYSNYGIISNEHEHYMDRKQKLGTQLVRLLMADNTGEYNIRGLGKKNGKDIYKLLTGLFAAKALLHKNKLNELFNNESSLVTKILESMVGNSKYSKSTLEIAISVDKSTGKLNRLGDVIIKQQVEALLNSYIREEINNVMFDGGTTTMVTAAYSSDLHVVYDIDENGYSYIKYWEAIAPFPFKSLLSRYMDEEGFFNIYKFKSDPLIDEETKEKILELLGCRIPTESKHSIQHIKIVNFSVPQNGSCIYLPYEITTTAGSDFDIDHVYTYRYSFDWVSTVTTDGKKINVPKYVSYLTTDANGKESFMPVSDMNEKQINNAILDIYKAVLANSSSLIQELTPNGYEETKRAAYKVHLLNRARTELETKEEIKQHYLELESLSTKELNKKISTESNRIGLINQLNFFTQNAFGKGLLGQMAVNNVFLTLLQHGNVFIDNKFKVGLNGFYGESFSKIFDAEGKLRTGTIMEFLASAPDSAKDPVLVYLGADNLNINAIIAASISGYNINDIALFFNHPYIKNFLSKNFKGSDIITPERLVDAINRELLSKDDASYIKTKNLKGEEVKLYQGISGVGIKIGENNTMTMTNNPNVTEDMLFEDETPDINTCENLLGTFYNFFCVGQDLFELSMCTRQDSTSGSLGASAASVIESLYRIKTIKAKAANPEGNFSLKNINTLFRTITIPKELNIKNKEIRHKIITQFANAPLGPVQVQLSMGLEDVAHYYIGKFTEFSPLMMEAYDVMYKMNPSLSLSEETIQLMCWEFLKYKLFELPFFGKQVLKNGQLVKMEDKINYVVNDTWKDIQTIKSLYPQYSDNLLLKSLTVNKEGKIILENAGDLKDTEKQKLTDAWNDLLNAKEDKVRGVANNLIRYSFYRNCFRFAPDGFGHLCPDLSKIITGYTEKLQECYRANGETDNIGLFITELIYNCYDVLPQSYSISAYQDALILQNTYICESNGKPFYVKLKKHQIKPQSSDISTTEEKEGKEGERRKKKTNNEFVYYPHDLNLMLPIPSKSNQVNDFLDALSVFNNTVSSNSEKSEELKAYEAFTASQNDPFLTCR